MKVKQRSQITEVIVKRNVFHTLEHNGKKYTRMEIMQVDVPYMDCESNVRDNVVKWSVYVSKNTSSELSKKEVKDLRLEVLFEAIGINEKNGNG